MSVSVSLKMMSPGTEPAKAAESEDGAIEPSDETISAPESKPQVREEPEITDEPNSLLPPKPQITSPVEAQPETADNVEHPTAETVSEPSPPVNQGVTGPQQPASNPFEELLLRINEMKDSTYPLSAKKKGLQGKVVVKIKLDADGNLVSSEVFQSSRHSILDKAALDLINKVLEKPYRHNLGKDVILKLPVTYRLR